MSHSCTIKHPQPKGVSVLNNRKDREFIIETGHEHCFHRANNQKLSHWQINTSDERRGFSIDKPTIYHSGSCAIDRSPQHTSAVVFLARRPPVSLAPTLGYLSPLLFHAPHKHRSPRMEWKLAYKDSDPKIYPCNKYALSTILRAIEYTHILDSATNYTISNNNPCQFFFIHFFLENFQFSWFSVQIFEKKIQPERSTDTKN